MIKKGTKFRSSQDTRDFTINSIYTQTCDDSEIVVVNDLGLATVTSSEILIPATYKYFVSYHTGTSFGCCDLETVLPITGAKDLHKLLNSRFKGFDLTPLYYTEVLND